MVYDSIDTRSNKKNTQQQEYCVVASWIPGIYSIVYMCALFLLQWIVAAPQFIRWNLRQNRKIFSFSTLPLSNEQWTERENANKKKLSLVMRLIAVKRKRIASNEHLQFACKA